MFALILSAAAIGAPPPAAPPAERAIEIAGPKGPLAATFRSAGEDAPVLIIVPGSGPTDRDGNNPLGIKSATYRLLAEELAEKGVATLRIDKRGMFGSKAAIADANAVTIADYAHDVRQWAAKARELGDTSCVWVAGHSEGGLVALVAAQGTRNICGVIAIAAPGRRLADVMREQLRANPANAPVLEPALSAIAALEKGETVETAKLPSPLQPLFDPAVQPFIRDLFSYDPAKLASRYEGALMILQGSRDLQVGEADAKALAAAQPNARLHIVPGANHVLKAASEDRADNLASYGDHARPLAPGVSDAIAAFIFSGGR